MRAERGELTAKILDALRDFGPMTCAELCLHLQMRKEKIGAVLFRLMRGGTRCPKRVHVTAYVYDAEGMRRYPRGVFAFGNGVDAKKPKADPLVNRRKYENRKKRQLNSVWMLGMTLRERRRAGMPR